MSMNTTPLPQIDNPNVDESLNTGDPTVPRGRSSYQKISDERRQPTLVTTTAATFRLFFPFAFCENWEKLPLSYLMIADGATVWIMIIIGYIMIARKYKPLCYIYVTFYVIALLGSIVAIVFCVLTYHDVSVIYIQIDKTIEKCFKDQSKSIERINDPFVQWIQRTV
ncbi:hypothetical protein RF11_11382 [Thelohanellus kitauei]|uniref:Uncharacterized protein n=1 Tax=Thelohanellus kitauei TaxID=669202 RepID=A0A0C2N4Y4_THEKT|nr:hypothetical protein RF11_11382 [Thelohanellus kitauei]